MTSDAIDANSPLALIATAAAGTEAVVKRELVALGYTARTVTPGRLLFRGDASAVCRTNLWLRAGERVLIQIGTFPATDFGALFDGTAAFPWEQWLPRDAEFPVNGRSHHSLLSSVPACQKIVKKAIVERLRKAYQTETLPETGPRCAVEISLRDDVASLTLDTTGVGLHKRGYRRLVGEAQLRETLASVLVQLSYWRPGAYWLIHFAARGRFQSKPPSLAATSRLACAAILPRRIGRRSMQFCGSKHGRKQATSFARHLKNGCWATTSIPTC